MLPTLPIGPLRLQTYGLFLLLAYFAGLWLAARLAPRRGLTRDHVYNAGFYALLGGLIAGRLGHAIAYLEVYRTDPLQIVALSPGAFLPLPGVLGALLVLALYVWRHRLPALQLADVAAPGVLLALAIANVGAFLAGRALGAATGAANLPWAVELFGVQRHPAALYETLAALGWLAAVLWAERRSPQRPGRLALLTVFGYAVGRLFLEPLRAASPTIGDGWRLPQALALIALGVSGWLLGVSATPVHRPPAE